MPAQDVVFVPISRQLYNDLVRFSDGQVDGRIAETLIESWIERTLSLGDQISVWGDRAVEVAETYAPHVAKRWRKEDEDHSVDLRKQNRPLIWKEVSIPAGADVRMQYDGIQYYGVVVDGSIEFEGERYTPSSWASKVAGGTSRNAWRDIYVKEPLGKFWIPAEILRKEARQEQRRRWDAEIDLGEGEQQE
ncbi:hypothetical protein ABIE65_003641 [Constrictibacter sp. MBR-5]|uniref:hypothetical protein n=1 Tax=Constrictibacter sp. MBR-5 TaxID=3156467 RepID=UPI0033933412